MTFDLMSQENPTELISVTQSAELTAVINPIAAVRVGLLESWDWGARPQVNLGLWRQSPWLGLALFWVVFCGLNGKSVALPAFT